MSLELFAQLTGEGDQKYKGDHIFTGTKSDMVAVAQTLNDAFQINRRKKAVMVISLKFNEAAHSGVPVRLSNDECQLLEASVSIFGQTGSHKKAKSTNARKLADLFDSALCIW